MKAITLTAPWAWAVAHAGKDIENRKTRCPSLLGQRIAIHACSEERQRAEGNFFGPFEWMHERGLTTKWPTGAECHYGRIVAVATVIGWHGADIKIDDGHEHAHAAHPGHRSPWFTGPVGWLLHDVRTLAEPVSARGKQGIWTVDADAEARILAQLGGA